MPYKLAYCYINHALDSEVNNKSLNEFFGGLEKGPLFGLKAICWA